MSTMSAGWGATAYIRPDHYQTRALDQSSLSAVGRGAATLPTWDDLINSLLDIDNLNDDWDGQGAEAPPQGVVDGAIALAQTLRAEQHVPADRVVPSVNGTIYFEWYLPEGYREIEVITSTRAEGRFVRKGSDATEAFTIGM